MKDITPLQKETIRKFVKEWADIEKKSAKMKEFESELEAYIQSEVERKINELVPPERPIVLRERGLYAGGNGPPESSATIFNRGYNFCLTEVREKLKGGNV